jgi:hypothetical protein
MKRASCILASVNLAGVLVTAPSLAQTHATPSTVTVNARTEIARLGAHDVQGAAGNVNVLLVNKDPANSYAVTATLQGAGGWGLGDVFTYGENSTWIAQSAIRVSNSSFTITVPPYSLTAVRVH